MASHIGSVNARALQLLPPHAHTHSQKHPLVPLHDLHLLGLGERSRLRLRVRVSDGDDSYLHMWKNAVDKERKSIDFQNIAHNSPPPPPPNDHDHEDLEKKTLEFHKILQVSKEERDRIQRMQVIDRAAAAIAAARAILNENASRPQTLFQDLNTDTDATGLPAKQQGKLDSLCIPILIRIYCDLLGVLEMGFDFLFFLKFYDCYRYHRTKKHAYCKLPETSGGNVLLGIGKKKIVNLMKRLHIEKRKKMRIANSSIRFVNFAF